MDDLFIYKAYMHARINGVIRTSKLRALILHNPETYTRYIALSHTSPDGSITLTPLILNKINKKDGKIYVFALTRKAAESMLQKYKSQMIPHRSHLKF